MQKKYLFLGIGIILTFFALYLINLPFIRVSNYFQQHGIALEAVVKDKVELGKKFKTSNGTWEHFYYRIEVELIDPDHKFKTTANIKEWTGRGAYQDLNIDDLIEVYFLPRAKRKEGMPDVLLSSTVNTSFFGKLPTSLKGDLSRHALGLIILIFGMLGLFLGMIFFFEKPLETEGE